jgi:hypothetical protein
MPVDLLRDSPMQMMIQLRPEAVTVDPKGESYDFEEFGLCTDPEGNRVERWQSVAAG